MSGLLTYSAERTNESQSIITIDDAIDMLEMGDVHEADVALEELFTTLETGEKAVTSLESLVAYKEDLITSDATVSKQTIDALNITLESVCNILDYPVDHVTMSTETITEDDTTLVLTTGLEKEKELLAKAWEAIKRISASIMQSVADMITKIATNVKNLPKAMAAVVTAATDLEKELGGKMPTDVTFEVDPALNIAAKFAIIAAMNGYKLDISVLDKGIADYNTIASEKALLFIATDVKSSIKIIGAELALFSKDESADTLKALTNLKNFSVDLIKDLLKTSSNITKFVQDQTKDDSPIGVVSYYGNTARVASFTYVTRNDVETISKLSISSVDLDIDVPRIEVNVISPADIIKNKSVSALIANVTAKTKAVDKINKASKGLLKEVSTIATGIDDRITDDKRKGDAMHLIKVQSSMINYISKTSKYSVMDSYKQAVSAMSYFTASVKAIEAKAKAK